MIVDHPPPDPPENGQPSSPPEESAEQHVRYEQIGRNTRGGLPRLISIMRESPHIYQRILALIRAGAYESQVVQAFGIDKKTFSTWMAKGARAQGGTFHQFFVDINQARAIARVEIESRVAQIDPKFWLSHGPGKSRPDEPGWGKTEEINVNQQISAHITARVEDVNNADLGETLRVMSELGMLSDSTKDDPITFEHPVKHAHQLTPPDHDPPPDPSPSKQQLPLTEPPDILNG